MCYKEHHPNGNVTEQVRQEIRRGVQARGRRAGVPTRRDARSRSPATWASAPTACRAGRSSTAAAVIPPGRRLLPLASAWPSWSGASGRWSVRTPTCASSADPKKSGRHLLRTPAMKMATIKQLAGQHPVRKLCRMLGVARSAYYAAQKKAQRPRAKENARLGEKAREFFEASGRTYGSPRLAVALRRAGEPCGRHRMARLMARRGLRATPEATFSSPHHRQPPPLPHCTQPPG